jgi:hypothetical protein
MPLLSAFASGYGATAPKRSEGGTELEWFFVVQLQRRRPTGAGTARLRARPWPKFFSTRKKGLNMFLNVKKIMPPFCGSITGQTAWRARLC